MNNKKLSFSKKMRLISKYEFSYVFENSHKIITNEIIIFTTINHLKFPRIGIIIAKKYIKHAYKRNHIKRHIRESFRIHQHILPKIDFVITIRKNILNLNNISLQKILKTIWQYNYYDTNFTITNKINTHIPNVHQSVI